MSTWLITGCSTGLGRALAEAVLARGDNAAVTARDVAGVQDLREVGPLGIAAMVVEPGAFRTDFSGRSLRQSDSPIADYADTAGARRKENDSTHGTQAGGPAKAAEAIIAAVSSASPPAMLMLGEDAVGAIRGTLRDLEADVDAWESTSVATALD